MRTLNVSGLVLIVASFVGGCGSNATETAGDTTANRASSTMSRQGMSSASGTSGGSSCSANGAVYFGYDSTDLDASSRNRLADSAACVNRGQGNVTVTGMADPRGTEEYNLALGDRRARTVTGYMANLGVDDARLRVRSVGEEMASGEDESGWARDRRAEIEAR